MTPMNKMRMPRRRPTPKGAVGGEAKAKLGASPTPERYPTDEPPRPLNIFGGLDKSQPDINDPIETPGMNRADIDENARYNLGFNRSQSLSYRLEPGMTGYRYGKLSGLKQMGNHVRRRPR